MYLGFVEYFNSIAQGCITKRNRWTILIYLCITWINNCFTAKPQRAAFKKNCHWIKLFIVKFLQSWCLAWHYLTSLYMNWKSVYNKPLCRRQYLGERYSYRSRDLAALYVIKIHFKVDRCRTWYLGTRNGGCSYWVKDWPLKAITLKIIFVDIMDLWHSMRIQGDAM